MLRAPELVARSTRRARGVTRRRARSARAIFELAGLVVAGTTTRARSTGSRRRAPSSSAATRVVAEPGLVRVGDRELRVRPARDRHRLVAGDPADRRARRGRLLDERGGDRGDRGARLARSCSAAAPSDASSRSSSCGSGSQVTLVAGATSGCCRASTRRPRRSSRQASATTASTFASARTSTSVDGAAACSRRRRRGCRSTGCSSRPAVGRTWTASSRSGSRSRGADRGRRAAARRRERLGDRRRHRHRALHARRQVPRAHRRLRHGGPRRARRPPRDPGDDLHGPAGGDRRERSTGGVASTWPLSSTPRLATYERPKRDGFVKLAADPERRVAHRRRRRRAGGRRVAPAADARDPGGDADRGAPRRDPALPDVQRGRLPRAARAEPRPLRRRLRQTRLPSAVRPRPTRAGRPPRPGEPGRHLRGSSGG